MRKEGGFYSDADDLGEQQTHVSKPFPSGKPRGKPSHPRKDQNQRQSLQFLLPFNILSFGNGKWPLSGHPGGSVFLSATVRLQAPSWDLSVGPVLPSTLQLLWSEGPMNTPASTFLSKALPSLAAILTSLSMYLPSLVPPPIK